MLVALWPRMSRRTCSDTPISAARELHVCLRSWNVRLTILVSRHALVNAFLVSMNRDPVLSLVKIYSPVVSSAHSLFRMAARDFEYLLVPVRKRSRGRHSPGREGPIMKFPKKAACWLRPLLERYFEKRSYGGVSEYLFVSQFDRTRRNRPVCSKSIRLVVNRASRRVLNGTVNPRDLRGTAAAIMAERSKRRGAILTKLGYKSLCATRYNYLETFPLEPKACKQRQPPAGG